MMLRNLMRAAASLTLPAAALMAAPLLTAPASQAEAAEPDGAQLARFVCQSYDAVDERYYDYVAVIDQLSVMAVDPKTNFGFDTIPGSALSDPDHPIFGFGTGEVPFRMRIYRDTLISDEKTVEQIVGELVAREADKDPVGRVMDYSGLGGRYFISTFSFRSTGPYHFVKSITIDLDREHEVVELTGIVRTNNSAVTFVEDGIYHCQEPILRPAEG